MLENQENVKSVSDKGYHAVPLPYTRNYIPPKTDLMFIDEQVQSASVDVIFNVSSSVFKTVESKVESVEVKNKGVYSTVETKPIRKNNFSPPIIEDQNSDDESKVEFEPKVEEDRLKLTELMELSTKMSDRVLDLEKIKTAQVKEIADLKKRVKKLEKSQVSDKVKTGLRYKAASPVEESFVKSSKMLENQENVKFISDKGYHVVPLPYKGNYIPPKLDLMFIDEQVKSEYVDVVSNVSSSAVKGVYKIVETKPVRKNNFSRPIIEDWNSNDESNVEFEHKVKVKTVRPYIEKIKFVKTTREKVEKVETPKQHKHYPSGNQRKWNNLMSQRLRSNIKMINKDCYVCDSFEHL
nr:retrotransposon Orf1 [Tanacetum cinerariifolium]